MDVNETQLLGLSGADVTELMGVADTKGTMAAIKAAGQRGAARARFDQSLTRGQKLLLNKVNELPTDALKKLKAGNLKLSELIYYNRVILAPAANGETPIWDENTRFEQGVCNVQDGVIPKGSNFLLEAITVGYAAHATSVIIADHIYNSFESAVPAALLNAEIIIQIGEEKLPPIPGSSLFVVGDTSTANGLNGNKYYLKRPIMGKGGDQVRVHIKWPKTFTALTGNHFLELKLICQALVAA